MSSRIERSLNPRRAPMLLSLGFGAVALLLATIVVSACGRPRPIVRRDVRRGRHRVDQARQRPTIEETATEYSTARMRDET